MCTHVCLAYKEFILELEWDDTLCHWLALVVQGGR